MKKLFALFLLPVIVALLLTELYFRLTYSSYRMSINWTALNSRWHEPYLEFGEFRSGFGRIEESPQDFQYRKAGPIFLYHPEKEIHSITERGRFLYLEREKEAENRKDKRIFVMGASAALGDGGSGSDQRFWVQLERKIRKMCSSEKIHVIPAAIRSFISTQERIALELYVLPLKPDAVVFLHGYNDLNHTESMARPGDPYNQGVTYARSESFLYQTIQWWATISRTVEFFSFRHLNQQVLNTKWAMATRDRDRMEQYSKEIGDVFLENVRQMSKRCKQENVFCYFVNQPTRLDDQTRGLLYWNSYNKVANEYAKQLSPRSRSIDLVPKYMARPELFMDMVHMSNDGQELVAEDVLKLLYLDKKNICSNL